MGWRIQKLRKEHKLTQREFAHRVGVGQGAVSAWETGKVEGAKIPAPAFEAICRVLEVSPSHLRSGRESHSSAAEDDAIRLSLPAIPSGVEVMQVARRGLAAEARTLAQAQKVLREAVKAGKPVWLVVG